MAFAIPAGMQDAESRPSRRGRRGLIAVLVLLLILLPLYLWPLRGDVGGLPGASSLSGAVRDPRSAAAVAQIPGDVWNALMGQPPAPPPSLPAPPPKPSLNLTMITSAQGIPGSGLDEGEGNTLSDSPAALVRGLLAQAGSSDAPGDDTVSTPTEFVSTPSNGTGTGGAPGGFGSGGYPGFGNFGPSTGGGPGGGPGMPGLPPSIDPRVPEDLAPTPEPATLLLAGSNLALLGAAAWRRRRRRLGIPPTA